MTSLRFALPHTSAVPLTVASPRVVMGRLWTIQQAMPSQAHSTSCGLPQSVSMRSQSAPRWSTTSGWRSGALLGWRRRVSRRCRSGVFASVYCSGCTTPETTATPRPGAAWITMRVRSPCIGSAVNATPARRAGTMCCRTTAIRGMASVSPMCCRYATARADHHAAQQARTYDQISSTDISKKLSYTPA